jgi:hypothetical protein
MKNLKTLLFPLLFGLCIGSGIHSQAQELKTYKNVEYIKEHIKGQIRNCRSVPSYNTCNENIDSAFSLGFTLVNRPEPLFSVAASNEVSKADILSLIKKYDDPLTPNCIEAGVKFNRYFLCGIIKDTKCINASDIKVYKAKCREIDKYNNLNAPEVKTYIANPKE